MKENPYKPTPTKRRIEGKIVYSFLGKSYIKDKKSTLCNALEGFKEVTDWTIY